MGVGNIFVVDHQLTETNQWRILVGLDTYNLIIILHKFSLTKYWIEEKQH